MVWGFEYLIGFNAAPFSALAIINSCIFLFIFGYLGARGHAEKPQDNALTVAGYSVLIGFVLTLLAVPPIVLGVGYIVGYIFVCRYVLNMKSYIDFGMFAIYIFFIFGLLAIQDELTREWLTLFAIVIMFLQSEIRLRKKARAALKKG